MLYIDLPDRHRLERLANYRHMPSVTIYLESSPLTQEADKTRIALKNHAREAVKQMEEAGVEKRAIWPIEEALAAFDEDDDFWAHQAYSLAIFSSPERTRHFRLANQIKNAVHVSDRFHITPLLRAISFSNNAVVLALSEGATRMIEVPAEGAAEEIRGTHLPHSANDAVGRTTLNDRDHNKRLVGDEGKNVLLKQYVRQVDKAVAAVMKDRDVPLILAAADPLENLFRAETGNHHLAPRSIEGNPEHKSVAELAEAAREIITDLQKAKVDDLNARFAERRGDGRAVTDIADVARAATFGAVDTLYMDMDAVVPGHVDEESGAVDFEKEETAGSYGVISEVARRALSTSARIIAVRKDDLPDANSPVAAILRYAV